MASPSNANMQRAVNFLRTPSIASNPSTDAKVSFLLTTGLSREEIAMAFELAGQQLLTIKEEKGVEGETPRKQSKPPKAAAVGTPDTGHTLPVTPDKNDEHGGDDASSSEPAPAAAASVHCERTILTLYWAAGAAKRIIQIATIAGRVSDFVAIRQKM